MPVSNKEAPVKGILDNVLRYLKKEEVNTNERVVLQNITGEDTIIGDEYLIAKAIASGINFMLNKREEGKLTFSVERGHITYGPMAMMPPITPAICFFLTYKGDSAVEAGISHSTTPFDLDNLPKELVQSEQIIQSHYGVLRMGPRFLHLAFPEDINKVRPNIKMDPVEKLFGKVSIDAKEDKAFLAAAGGSGKFNIERLKSALRACKSYHSKQKRKIGEPFYLHPVVVATILLPLTESEDVIIATLVHDVVEDTPFQLVQMDLMFDSKVTRIVKEITHLYNQDGRKVKIANKRDNHATLQHYRTETYKFFYHELHTSVFRMV